MAYRSGGRRRDGGYERERDFSLKERTGESGEEMKGEGEGGGWFRRNARRTPEG